MGLDVFRLVYEVVVEGRRVRPEGGVVEDAVRVAALNKVGLHFMRAVGLEGRARDLEEARMRRVVRLVGEVTGALRGLERWCFFKLVRPVVYVPSDVDLLVERGLVSRVVSRLRGLGFRVEVVEPYCVTLRRGWAVVDVYVQPTLGGVVYLDAGGFLEHVRVASYHGVEVPALEDYVEALVSVAHAIYKERVYTLNDYVTVGRWFSRRSLELARELECTLAVSFAMRIHGAVEGRGLALPYRVPVPLWVGVLVFKALRDSVARATIGNVFGVLRDRRIGRRVVSKFTRRTY